MSIKEKLLKFISYFTDKKITKGIGISCDNHISLKEMPSPESFERPLSSVSVMYQLNPHAGRFELINLVRKDTETFYKLRHNSTAEIFTISEKMFPLLFRKTPDKECND